MSSAVGSAILTVALTSSLGGVDKPALPPTVIETALKKSGCTLPPSQVEIIGTEQLSSRVELVEVTCWRGAYNAGSILFAVPENRPEQAQLLAVENWQDGRIRRAYSVASPGFDAKTRTLSATYKARAAGDCGTIQEMKWTGWHFRLLNVWRKDKCDGEPFEWDSRDKWQVFPQRGLERDREGSPAAGGHAEASR